MIPAYKLREFTNNRFSCDTQFRGFLASRYPVNSHETFDADATAVIVTDAAPDIIDLYTVTPDHLKAYILEAVVEQNELDYSLIWYDLPYKPSMTFTFSTPLEDTAELESVLAAYCNPHHVEYLFFTADGFTISMDLFESAVRDIYRIYAHTPLPGFAEES